MYQIFKITSNPTVDFAAEELKKYMRMMMPRCGEIDIVYDPEAKVGFRLGLMSDFGLDTSDAEDITLDDIVYIDTDPQGGIIAGSNPGALLIGVYRYLRFCGCRWLFPGVDGEYIPMIAALPPVNYRKLADHRYRGQCNEGAEYQTDMIETIDFTPKIGMNTYMLEFDNPATYYNSYYDHRENTVREPEPVSRDTVLQWKRQCEVEIQKRGLKYHDMGHGWTAEPFGIVSDAGWQKVDESAVPEASRPFLAMMDGERKLYHGVPLNTNICMSNPKARHIIAEYVADYAEKQNNVDFLHIWLADATRNHCECEECRKKDVPDWYVMLLNDIDASLTKRNLDTHLVFIVYTDTFWAPKEQKINNPKRFSMLYAPIHRLYTETYGEEPNAEQMTDFALNANVYPEGMAACLAYLKEWQKDWHGDCFCYEYHFWRHQYYDPSGLYHAKLIYDDICALKKQGLSGIVEDGSQRSFFPNGFSFYVYGETLYDSTVDFETMKEDYFSHAYGENWRDVVAYLEQIRENLDFAHQSGLCSIDKSIGSLYNPEFAPKAAKVKEIVADFAPMIEANKNQYYRVSTVAWRLLREHQDMLKYIADITEQRALGNNEAADAIGKQLIDDFSRREIYIERYYDQYLFVHCVRGKLL